MAYRKFLLVLLVPALAGGCAQPAGRSAPPPAGRSASSPAQPTTPGTGGQTPSPEQSTPRRIGGSVPPPGQPTTTPDAGELTPLPELDPAGNGRAPWTLVRRGVRDTDLVLLVGGLACRRVVGAHLTETAQTVTIAVLVGAPRSGPCIDVDRTQTVLVRAASPIGAREIRPAPLTGSFRPGAG